MGRCAARHVALCVVGHLPPGRLARLVRGQPRSERHRGRLDPAPARGAGRLPLRPHRDAPDPRAPPVRGRGRSRPDRDVGPRGCGRWRGQSQGRPPATRFRPALRGTGGSTRCRCCLRHRCRPQRPDRLRRDLSRRRRPRRGLSQRGRSPPRRPRGPDPLRHPDAPVPGDSSCSLTPSSLRPSAPSPPRPAAASWPCWSPGWWRSWCRWPRLASRPSAARPRSCWRTCRRGPASCRPSTCPGCPSTRSPGRCGPWW